MVSHLVWAEILLTKYDRELGEKCENFYTILFTRCYVYKLPQDQLEYSMSPSIVACFETDPRIFNSGIRPYILS